MKREILCSDCYPKAMKACQPKVVKTDEGMMFQQLVNPPEHHRFVHGILIINCYCDSCDLPLEEGLEVVAASYWLDGQIGFMWEEDYIEKLPQTRYSKQFLDEIRNAVLKEPPDLD